MNEFLQKEFYGNTVFNWGTSLIYILGAILLGKLIYWFTSNILKKITQKSKSKLDDILVDMLEEPLILALIILGLWLGIKRLVLSESVDQTFGNIYRILITINVTWFVSRFVSSLIDEYVRPITEKSKSDLDDQLLPIVKKGLTAIIWILGIIIALNNAGYDVGALIAGLGIGGLALAMAAKDTISNFFGGITIFSDKPFKLNDRIKLGGFDGNVIEIGIRCFRIRTLDGTVVTIPNSKITDSIVENISMEPSRKITLNLGLTYSTTPEQIDNAMAILETIAKQEAGITEEYKIAFTDFGNFSLGIVFIYYIAKDENILKVRTSINRRILAEFNKNNLNFAFPTQTIQLEKN